MDANFNDFLQGPVWFPNRTEESSITQERKSATGGVVVDSPFGCHSKHRIPTLYQYALFSVAKLVNTVTSLKEQAEQLPTLFTYIKELPEHVKKAILPQLTFTALRKYHGDEIWDMMAHPTKETLPILLSCMKQEDDMMRYLYGTAPENEYLLETQDKILLDVFNEVPAKCLVTTTLEYPDITIRGRKNDLKNAKGAMDNENALGPVVDQETFKKNWSEFTYGLLDDLDWSNCFAAGGSVLACLRKLPDTDKIFISDIDMYLVGLEKEGAKQKLQHIWDVLQRNIGDRKLYVVKTKNTFTFFANYPFRPIQVITGLYKSPTEVLCSFDLDCITVGYNGSHVLALPRFVLSMSTALNFLDSDMNLASKLQYSRLSKYADRGFSTCLPITCRTHELGEFDYEPDLLEDQELGIELPSKVHKFIGTLILAKAVLLSQVLYQFDIAAISKITAWNQRWRKGISAVGTRWPLSNNIRMLDLARPQEFLRQKELDEGELWYESTYQSVEFRFPSDRSFDVEFYLNLWKSRMPVAKSEEDFKMILDEATFATEASSMFNCFLLDIIVPCKYFGKESICNETMDSSSPLSLINTSLSRLDYEYFCVGVKFTGLDALWNNQNVEMVSEPVKIGTYSWCVKLEAAKGQDLVWISLLVEENASNRGMHNNLATIKHCFANFILSVLSTTDLKIDHLNLDGSLLLTSGSKQNEWKISLLKSHLVTPAVRIASHVQNVDLPPLHNHIRPLTVFVDETGDMSMKLHVQYVTTNVNVVGL